MVLILTVARTARTEVLLVVERGDGSGYKADTLHLDGAIPFVQVEVHAQSALDFPD